MGVDHKVLARNYVFGEHWCWSKSLCERSATEFAKEMFLQKGSALALDSWRHDCALA